MIEMFFQFGGEYILIKVDGNNVLFGNTAYGAQLATIDGIRLSYDGVIKEFPDLQDSPIWKEEAIIRFKNEIRNIKTEKLKAKFIADDLSKHGYVLKRMRQNGFREEKY